MSRYRCPKCGYTFKTSNYLSTMRFCPKCGTLMVFEVR